MSRGAWSANQWLLIGETSFSSVPLSNSLVSVSDPRRAFWADTAPFSGPLLASCVASGTTEVHQVVKCAGLGREVPGDRQKQLTQTLIVRLLKTHFFPPILDFKKSTEYSWVCDQTWGQKGAWQGRLSFGKICYEYDTCSQIGIFTTISKFMSRKDPPAPSNTICNFYGGLV